MASRLRRLRRGTAVLGIVTVAAGITAAGGAIAAPLAWDKVGAFETCLEGHLESWLKIQSELVVNDDPAAAKTNDQSVANWTAETLAQCGAGRPNADASSSDRFIKHMAQWRQHIYDRAAEIRRKGLSD